MKANMNELLNKIHSYWSERTKSQKITLVSSTTVGLLLLLIIAFISLKPNYTPLYSSLSMQEVSQIKEELETRGIPYEISANGTSISVPKEHVNNLLVDLAGQGIPRSGGIDYSFFSENASWGITDNEFNMMKLDAMQTELASLIKSIEGINDAKVLINLPKESIFVNESNELASASIILQTRPGYQFKENQIESLYHLVSKAVPNLPPENIIIRNQYLEFFDLASTDSFADEFSYQQSVKKDIERDIRQRLQQMLDTMIGVGKVLVSVTADVDFTAENRVEELIEPVDVENMEGLPVSIETIQETYSGSSVDSVVGTGESDIPNYPATGAGNDGEYELVKEMINNEFNRIRKNIVESPFKIRDLGIQVAVDRVRSIDGDDVEYLSAQEQLSVEESIASILNSIISTSIDKDYGEVNPDEKISIVFQEFSTQMEDVFQSGQEQEIPSYIYIIGIILLIIIIVLVFLLFNRKSKKEEIIREEIQIDGEQEAVPDLEMNPDSESEIKKKQLELIAREQPEDFVKLLRSWMVDE